ncbi:MAG: hypothetical protein WAL87_00915 [Chthoniobacterales bacterium]
MQTMMRNITPLIVIALATLANLLHADVVVLKDGSKITGEIIAETSDSITVEYFATRTIKDQKTISKTEIDKVEKISPDRKAFEELGSLETPATVLDTSFYDALVDRKLPEFIAKYPDSPCNAEAINRLNILKEERNRVNQGDRRLESVWITAAEIAAEPYQTGAMIQYTFVKAGAASNNPVETLRTYELLEKKYPGSAVMPDAVAIALKQLDVLQAQIPVARANGEIELKNISNALVTARADEAKMLKDGLERDANIAKAAIKTAGVDGSKFFAIFQKSKEALDALQLLVAEERVRLSQFQITTMREGIAAAKEGIRMIREEKLKAARDYLVLSQKLWPVNHDIIKLKNAVDQAETAQAAKAEIEAKDAAAKAAQLASKEAAEKAAKQKMAAEIAEKERAASVAAEKAAATPTPTPSQDVAGKLKDRSDILEVLEK